MGNGYVPPSGKAPERALRDVKWQEDYIESCADPTDTRKVKDIAEENGVDQSIIYRWRKQFHKEISEEVEKRRSKYKAKMRSKAWKALDTRLAKDTKAIELMFKLMGDLVERSESKVEYMSPEDKRERVKKLLSQVLAKAGKKDEGDDKSDGEGVVDKDDGSDGKEST
jgi:transposase-like protein